MNKFVPFVYTTLIVGIMLMLMIALCCVFEFYLRPKLMQRTDDCVNQEIEEDVEEGAIVDRLLVEQSRINHLGEAYNTI